MLSLHRRISLNDCNDISSLKKLEKIYLSQIMMATMEVSVPLLDNNNNNKMEDLRRQPIRVVPWKDMHRSLSISFFILLSSLGYLQGFTLHPSGIIRRRLLTLHTSTPSLSSKEVVDGDMSSSSLEKTKNVGFSSIDPLLSSFLLDNMDLSIIDLGGIGQVSDGIQLWKYCLQKGRIPTRQDFVLKAGGTNVIISNEDDADNNNDTMSFVWPEEPLFSKLANTMIELQLSRFVLKHPETVNSVIRSLLTLTVEFTKQVQKQRQILNDDDDESGESDDEEDNDELLYGVSWYTGPEDDVESPFVDDSAEVNLERIAEEVSAGLAEKWGGVVNGIGILDQLFGFGNDLLSFSEYDDDDDDENFNDDVRGFGLNDGIWKHSGWKQIPTLQEQIASMPELKDLLKELGRRPTSENSDRIHKFAPRRLQDNGIDGAQFDPLTRESVSGITLSDSFSEMLPSEAVLLRGSSPSLRRLFLAKKVESKLLSYQLSGWTDVPSVPVTRPLYRQRMPSAPGGPIILCLDTSWSMSGMREHLSKAVVLASVAAAHKQRRECQVVAFSSGRNVMESGIITADVAGVRRLLEFLEHSFGGGTDVTGALKFAMTELDTDIMAAADILLISDGEIPDPPVPDDVMDALDYLKLRKGVEVHGLLVGKRESKPLSRLCTKTHDFLLGYDTLVALGRSSLRGTAASSSSTALSCRQSLPSHVNENSSSLPLSKRVLNHWYHRRKNSASFKPRSYFNSALYARASSSYDDDDDFDGSRPRGGKRKQKGKKNKKWKDDDDDDGDDDYYHDNDSNHQAYDDDDDDEQDERQSAIGRNDPGGAGYWDEVQAVVTKLRESVLAEIDSTYSVEQRSQETTISSPSSSSSSWEHTSTIKAAIERVAEGLIERDEEARLVVLAMLANEHILLLGVPGTGKSILGRRLAKLCHGQFFQRLLTRFTTPEELFGPLSLQSLEQDEYRRCTAGFLPTSSIAFLDEIFKANSAILNTLLTILNERLFDNAGGQEICPIRCVVGASNELPESDELVALYDRFLIRKEVLPVSDDGIIQLLSTPRPGYSDCDDTDDDDANFSNINSSTAAAASAATQEENECDIFFDNDSSSSGTSTSISTATIDDITTSLSNEIDTIIVTNDICELIRDLRNYMKEEYTIEISDRRLVKVMKLLKISAITHHRNYINYIDCMLLQHCLWTIPEHKVIIRDWLLETIKQRNGGGNGSSSSSSSSGTTINQFRLLLDSIRQQILTIIKRTSGDITGTTTMDGNGIGIGGNIIANKEDINLLKSLQNELSSLIHIIEHRYDDVLQFYKQLLLSSDIDNNENENENDDYLWMNVDEYISMKQFLLPSTEQMVSNMKQLLVDAKVLETCISVSKKKKKDDDDNDDSSFLSISNELRYSIIESIWEEGMMLDVIFTDDELDMDMREAKGKYDIETFRKWKRARKKHSQKV